MYLTEIMEKLSTKLSISTMTIGHNVQIYGVTELLPGEVSAPTKDDLLYFVHDAALLQGRVPQSIVCAASLPDALQGQAANAIQIAPGQYDELLCAVRNLLNDAYRLQALYSSMLQMIFDGRGVSGILSSIADRADSSIVVINMGGKILAHSAPFRLKEPLWAQSVQQGYCPAEFMEHIRALRQADASQPGAGPYVRYCEEMGLYYLCSKITRDSALFGYVFMIQPDKSFGPDCYETLSLVSKTLTETTLKNQDRISLHSYLYGEILTDMLNGISQKQASTRIQIGKLAFPSYMRVLAVRPLYYHGESVLTGDVQARLEALFSVEQSVVYQKSVVLLVDVQKNRAIPQPQLDALRELCEKNYLLAGTSNSFTDPTKFQEYYRQAEKTIVLSQRTKAEGYVHCYTDFAFFDLLDALPEGLRLMRYCHPVLPLLRDYDQRKGTELYETLRTYTLTGFNQNKTAELLFMHRNTLNYRRQKIMELASIDLEDPQTKFLLSYSFAIDLFLEKNTLYS